MSPLALLFALFVWASDLRFVVGLALGYALFQVREGCRRERWVQERSWISPCRMRC
jgi:hypothetical protein